MSGAYFRFSGQKGLNVGANIQSDTTGKVWDGSAMVTEVAADFLTYAEAVPIPETATGSGKYRRLISAAAPDLPADKYHVTYYDLDYDPAEEDGVIFQTVIDYDGEDIVDDVDVTESVADICNKALSHLGVSTVISNLDTDDGPEADALNIFYVTARRKALRAFPWGFALRYSEPAEVEEDPTEEWAYSHRIPANNLRVLRILSGFRTDSRGTRIPHKIGGDATGGLIYSDEEDPEIEYIADVTDPSLYTPEFILAFSFVLASLISPRLSNIDAKLAVRAENMAKMEMIAAMATSANQDVQEETDGEFMESRA